MILIGCVYIHYTYNKIIIIIGKGHKHHLNRDAKKFEMKTIIDLALPVTAANNK